MITLEQYLAKALTQIRKFELLCLRKQNLGLMEREQSLRHWEEDYSMFLARTESENGDT